MTPTTLVVNAPMVFNHSQVHSGPAVWTLLAMAFVAGLAAGAFVALVTASNLVTLARTKGTPE